MINQLKQLQRIEPDADFLARSKKIILTASPKPEYIFQLRHAATHFFKVSFALGLMAVMLLVISGRFAPAPASLIASLNSKQLVRESTKYDFNLQLAEAQYYQEVDKQINLALNEIISNGKAGP